jgi:hypothetical protein
LATDPQFAAVINNGAALLGAAETNLQVPTTTSVIITAGANGTKVEEIDIVAASTSLAPAIVAGLVYVFLYDGATYHLRDVLTIPLPTVTASATVAPFSLTKTYTNLFFKTGWSLRASQSIAGNASLLKFSAYGADL